MAARLMYQISCNIQKPILVQSTNARRFHSLSPDVKRTNRKCSREEEKSLGSPRPRSMSSSPYRCMSKRGTSNIWSLSKRSVSRDQSNRNQAADEQDWEQNNDDADNQHLEQDEGEASASRKKPRDVSTVRENASKQLSQYHLQDSYPRKKKNLFNIYNSHMREYVQKDVQILPHLQPNRLQPYGTGNNITFPYRNTKPHSITYPISEPCYADQVAKSYPGHHNNFSKDNDEVFSKKQKREFSTNSDHNLIEKPHQENKFQSDPGLNISKIPSNEGFIQKTMKLFTDFGSSNKPEKGSVKVCDEIIQEYKKLNPDYKPVKKQLKPGSFEEKQAVETALNLISIYKNRYDNKVLERPRSQENVLNYRSKSAAEIQSRGHHESTELRPCRSNVTVNDGPKFGGQTAKPFANQFYEQSGYMKKVKMAPVIVTKGAKVDLLQSNAMPEIVGMRKLKPLGKNERLVSPWPSYAEMCSNTQIKRQYRTIRYPPTCESANPRKFTFSAEIQPKDSQPVKKSSIRSLHKLNSAHNTMNNSQTCSSINHNTNHVLKWKEHQGSVKRAKHKAAGCPPFSKRKNVLKKNPHSIMSGQFKQFKRDKSSSSSKGKKKKGSNLDTFPDICCESPPTPTPNFDPVDCPYVKSKIPDDVPRLKRLKKRSEPKEPPKVCPKPPECPPRADACYKVKQKELPYLPVGKCGVHECSLTEGEPFRRLEKRPVSEPRRKCPCQGPSCDCPPRADANLKLAKKCLPPITASKCPRIPLKCPEHAPALKRLGPIDIPEPSKECPVEDNCAPRADQDMKVKRKQLPVLEPSNCPTHQPPTLQDVSLIRLKKFTPKDPPRDCYNFDPCVENVRADDQCDYTVKPKKLPTMILKAQNNCVSTRKYNRDKGKKNFSTWSPSRIQNWTSIFQAPLNMLHNFSTYSCHLVKMGYYSNLWGKITHNNYAPLSTHLKSPQTSSASFDSKQCDKSRDIFKPKQEEQLAPFANTGCDFLNARNTTSTQSNPILISRHNPLIKCNSNILTNIHVPSFPKCHETYQPVRSISQVFYNKVTYNNRQMFHTSANKEKQNCKLPKNRKCPKIKMKKCKARARNACIPQYKFKPCKKRAAPYPSFSECGPKKESPTCECEPLPSKRFLQPKNPVIGDMHIQEPPPPAYEPVSVEKEKDCVMEKLKMVKGETKTCDNFDCPDKEFKGKELLEEAEQEAMSRAQPKIIYNKSSPAQDGQCGNIETDLCCIGEPELKNTQKEQKSTLKCNKDSSNKNPCDRKKFSTTSFTNHTAKSCKNKKNCCEEEEEEEEPTACQSRKVNCPVDSQQPKGFWGKICSYFKAKPNCPKPGEWKKNKLQEDAIKAAEAAGLKVCTPYDPCKTARGSRKPKKPKSPIRKGVSKVKNAQNFKKAGKSKTLAKKDESNRCPKCGKKKKSAKGKTKKSKKGKFANAFPPTKDGSPQKRSDPNMTPMDYCMQKIHGAEEMSTPKKKNLCKVRAASKKDPCKPKKDPCKPKKDPCKPKPKKDPCKPKPKKNPCKPKKDPCKPKPKTDPCKPKPKKNPCKPKKDPCKPKKKPSKPKKDPCKPKKKPSKPKKNPCKPKKDPCKPKKQKCEKVDGKCPPRDRQSCIYDLKDKPCKPQESPYPSFSECKPPFRKIRSCESRIAQKRSKDSLKHINLKPNARPNTQKEVCKKEKEDEDCKKGRRSYSTLSARKRALAFHKPTAWRKKFYSHGRIPNPTPPLLNSFKTSKNENLDQRLLAGIEEGIRKIKVKEGDLSSNSYYKTLKMLQKFSEEEINEFFREEPLFNPFEPLREDVREIVSFVCKLDPRNEQIQLLDNDISFQPRCIGISDVNAQIEELKIIESFKRFCNKLSDGSNETAYDYEETERLKTEKMEEELNNLLEKSKRK